jgi:uncharacterized protein YjbI with pentapeptide repeats
MKFLAALLVFVMIGTADIHADTLSYYVQLTPQNADLQPGPGADFSKRSLVGCVFRAVDFSGANFTGTDFRGAAFEQCRFENASFRDAIIDLGAKDSIFEPDPIGAIPNADFSNARVSWWNDKSSTISLSPFDLSPAQLRSTWNYKRKQMQRMKIHGDINQSKAYDFSYADLTGSAFVGGDFEQANFSGARIDSTFVDGSSTIPFLTLAKTDGLLEDRKSKGSVSSGRRTLRNVDWSQGRITGILDLSGVTLYDCIISRRYCDDILMTETSLRGRTALEGLEANSIKSCSNYNEGDFHGLAFYDCSFEGLDLSGFDLADAEFFECNFSGVKMSNSVVSRTSFGRESATDQKIISPGMTADQIRSTWNYKNDRMNSVKLPETVVNALQVEVVGE